MTAAGYASPARRLRDALEPIATHAFRAPQTRAALTALGLDGASVYVAGRAAALGAPTAEVVSATFAWLEPDRIAAAYLDGQTHADWQVIYDTRSKATATSLREIITDDPTDVADVLAAAVAAGSEVGRPLFGARRGQGRPDDPYDRLAWAAETLRDHRGDSHVAAAAVAGVGAVEMNVLTELWLCGPIRVYTATRFWNAPAMERAIAALTERGWLHNEAITADGRAARDEIEAATDRQDEPIIASIGAQLPGLCATLNAWGEQCIAAGAFPNDPFKRAAG